MSESEPREFNNQADQIRSNHFNKERPKTDFRICRRVAFTEFHKIHPEFDRIDSCRMCKEKVLYDFRDSEGIPHICLPCATILQQRGKAMTLGALDPTPVGEKDLNDQEQLSRMMISMSQHKHGETKVNLPEQRKM
jgi:hypothetical protein